MRGLTIATLVFVRQGEFNLRVKQEKYIDLNQFPHNKQGNISWKNCAGIEVEFFYNNKRHTLEIIDFNGLPKDYAKIKVDDIIIEKAHTSKITKLMFDDLFYEPNYFYNVGDIVRDLLILERFQKKRKTNVGSGVVNQKTYRCKCLIDGYVFDTSESDLKDGHGCPVCSSKIVIKGINDVATTDSELLEFFVNKEDAYTHSRCSEYKALVRCPCCGSVKEMKILELTSYGYVTCNKCSDGLSYPNKFACELFSQLSNQYIEYEQEYSPDWAGKFRYDNYIKLFDNKEIIVEMDGGFHYCSNKNYVTKNDKVKDELAESNGIIVVRVDCNYSKTGERYEYVKENIIKSINMYFDLSDIDWDKCNNVGLSNRVFDIAEYYKNNTKLGLEDIAEHFNISLESVYNYMYIAEDIGICEYVRADKNRTKNSKPIAMYDLEHNLVGVFKSAKRIEEAFPEKNFCNRSIRQYAHENKTYKGYIFKFTTYEEYQKLGVI